MADDQFAHGHGRKIAFHEFFWIESGQLRRKWQLQHILNANVRQQPHALLPCGQGHMGPVRGNHQARMRLKCDHNAGKAVFLCNIQHAPDKSLMPLVHAVKITDGYRRRSSQVKFLDRMRNLHVFRPR